jgi:hypothetical protein
MTVAVTTGAVLFAGIAVTYPVMLSATAATMVIGLAALSLVLVGITSAESGLSQFWPVIVATQYAVAILASPAGGYLGGIFVGLAVLLSIDLMELRRVIVRVGSPGWDLLLARAKYWGMLATFSAVMGLLVVLVEGSVRFAPAFLFLSATGVAFLLRLLVRPFTEAKTTP